MADPSFAFKYADCQSLMPGSALAQVRDDDFRGLTQFNSVVSPFNCVQASAGVFCQLL